MTERREPLLIPPEVAADDKAIEMIRGWIAGSGLHCALNVGHWHQATNIDERDAWGILLADIARHVAQALEEATGFDQRESLRRVVQTFVSEIGKESAPTLDQWLTLGQSAGKSGEDDDPRRD